MELSTELNEGLGIDLIELATKAAGAFMAPGVKMPTNGGPPGAPPGAPGAPGASTRVSPVIQTRISPQISPVMTQVQASPGAAVQAAPTMYPGGPQTATVPMGVPGMPPPPMGPPQTIPQYGYAPPPPAAPGIPWGTPTAMQTGEERIDWTMIAIAGTAAIAAMAIFGGRRRKRRS